VQSGARPVSVAGLAKALGVEARQRWHGLDWRRFVAAQWHIETAYGRPALWLAPAMGIGVLVHLALPAHPPAMLLYPLIGAALALGFAMRDLPHLANVGFILAALAGGLLSTDISIRLVDGPRIESVIPKATVTGYVRRIEERSEKAPRLMIEIVSIGAKAAPPRRLIAVGRSLAGLKIGQAVAFSARLAPLPLPTHPGAYSSGFAGFFDRIGGYAFVSGKPQIIDLPQPGIRLRVALAVEAWRTRMTMAIVERLGAKLGPIAAALVTGQRTAIPDDINREFNASGLLHVLSISGLHMALVAGGAFWLVRAVLAGFGPLALRLPLKKIAAVVAQVTAAFYEVASGAEVATTRSFIMICIVFAAVLLDRPALTMRNLALAALILLAYHPSSLVSPSFQMSFAATATLIAVYEHKLLPRLATREQSRGLRFASRFAEAVLATAIVSILVEIAMLPITLHHFHRIAWFGVVGNVLAMLIVDIFVMPMAVLTLIMLNIGPAGFAIDALGFGVARMLDIARFVAAFPHATSLLPGFSVAAMLCAVFGTMWMCFWKTRIALFGMVFYLDGVALWLIEPQPDLYVSASGRLVAVRDGGSILRADGVPADRFALSRWLEADGDTRQPEAATLSGGRRCDALGCTLPLGRDHLVAIAKTPEAVEEDCRRADILIIPDGVAPSSCAFPRLILDGQVIRKAAGMVIYWRNGQPRIVSNAQTCGERAWCPSSDLRSRDVWWRRPGS